MAERFNNIEDFIDAEFEIGKVDMIINELDDKAFDSFHRASDSDVLAGKRFFEMLDMFVNIIEFQNNKIKELEEKIESKGS